MQDGIENYVRNKQKISKQMILVNVIKPKLPITR